MVYALKRYCNDETAYTNAATKNKYTLLSMVQYTARDMGEGLTEFETLVNHSTHSKKYEVSKIVAELIQRLSSHKRPRTSSYTHTTFLQCLRTDAR